MEWADYMFTDEMSIEVGAVFGKSWSGGKRGKGGTLIVGALRKKMAHA